MTWQFAIDVGGTFTDCIGRSPNGTTTRHKLLSSGVTQGAIVGANHSPNSICDPRRRFDPPDFYRGFRIRFLDERGNETGTNRIERFDNQTGRLYFDPALATATSATNRYELDCDLPAPVIAIRYLLGLPVDQTLPPVNVRLGTTRGTNALLTRSGAATAFVTTRGFGDLLHIRDQQRPRLFDLNIRKPSPIFESTLEIDERVAADGTVLEPLDEAAARTGLEQLRAQGIRAVAICLLHGYTYPQHESKVAQLALDLGFEDISVSHHIAPLRKIVPRADTTVVNAYLNPVLAKYREQIEVALGTDARVRWMTSAGGLVKGSAFCGKESVLSGPAGGVVGFSRTAASIGFERTIGFDMGGTSTDVARFDGEFARVYETQKAGVHLTTPMLAIETVAAGGGSVCDFDGVQITVGPASAGADPGPACYGRGGPLTVTDMNLMLGRIRGDRFPFPLDRSAVVQQLQKLCDRIQKATGQTYTPQRLATGMLRLANTKMATAIQSISTAKGYDPREYTLVSFGGAAPQHACAVARELGIRNVLNHPDAGILSAVGIGVAPIIRHADQGIYQPWSEFHESIESAIEKLKQQAKEKFDDDEVDDAQSLNFRACAELRYIGQDAALSVDANDAINTLPARFDALHQIRYGYAHSDRELEVVAIRVIATFESQNDEHVDRHTETMDGDATHEPIATETTTVVFDDHEHSTAIYKRSSCTAGMIINGPAIVAESLSTTVINPGWKAKVLPDGQLLLTDTDTRSDTQQSGYNENVESLDPVTLEIFANAFAGIADQMGQTLRNTATSVNVKERLDFSCAIFDTDGDLIVNAPHVPVHLGAMSETIRHLIVDHPDMEPGDVFITNDPYRGGSHLPDVTVITPVFANAKRLFFTSSRAHHAEIGGIVPGSMPPFSKCLSDEGVLLTSQRVVAAGVSRMDALRAALTALPYPSRSVENNLADVAAQIAANQQGATRLLELTNRQGTASVLTAMRQLLSVAETKTRRALKRIGDGEYSFEDQLDDGSAIRVRISIVDGAAEIDFADCDDVHPENLNANRGIFQAAVIYVLRCLIAEDLPINQGILRAVELKLPHGILNPPDHGDAKKNAAMVGGNVETSQRIVDVLLGALGMAAASQGTMNNFLFGNESFGYYETICGGAGATPDAHGASAVHTHMTNTRLTDPEVLESRFPVRLREFKIRRDSGGDGQHRGGDGIVRQFEFLASLSVSLLTQRRTTAPYGLNGGSAGLSGENHLVRTNGTEQSLPSRIQLDVEPGDALTIKTPGGGGWGRL